MDQLSERWFRY